MPIDPRVYEACQQFDIEIITNGDVVHVRSALVPHPEIFEYRLDQFPQVKAKQATIIATETVFKDARNASRTDTVSDAIKSHLQEFLGTEGQWQPISMAVQSKLKSIEPSLRVANDIWWPLFKFSEKSNWRKSKKETPTLGRYYDEVTIGETWPMSFRDVKRAYCADSAMKIHFVGNPDIVCSHFGRNPENWRFELTDDTSVEDFIRQLDFYLYYPDRNYDGACDPIMLQAMSNGIPVITYPKLEKIFKDAAIYSAPERVSSICTEYWMDTEKYSEASKKSKKFVSKNCDVKSFMGRFRAL
ncbi:hypothetical protein GCM10027287_29850 [Bordetella muralis]